MTSGEAPRKRAMGTGRKRLRSSPNVVTARVIVISSENTPLVLLRSPAPIYLPHNTCEPTTRMVPTATQISWNGE